VASTQKELAQQKIQAEECHQQLQAAEAEAAVAAKGMCPWISSCILDMSKSRVLDELETPSLFQMCKMLAQPVTFSGAPGFLKVFFNC
jgi:hypothetical protein